MYFRFGFFLLVTPSKTLWHRPSDMNGPQGFPVRLELLSARSEWGPRARLCRINDFIASPSFSGGIPWQNQPLHVPAPPGVRKLTPNCPPQHTWALGTLMSRSTTRCCTYGVSSFQAYFAHGLIRGLDRRSTRGVADASSSKPRIAARADWLRSNNEGKIPVARSLGELGMAGETDLCFRDC